MLKEDKEFAQVHTAPKWQSWGFNSGTLAPESVLLPTKLYLLSKFSPTPFYLPWYWAQSSPLEKHLISDLWIGKERMIPFCLLASGPGAGLSKLCLIDVGGLSVPCSRFSSTPGLYLLYASKCAPMWLSKMSPDIAKYPRGVGVMFQSPPRLRSPGQGHKKEVQSWRGIWLIGPFQESHFKNAPTWLPFLNTALEREWRALCIFAFSPSSWEIVPVGMTSLDLGNIPTALGRGWWVVQGSLMERGFNGGADAPIWPHACTCSIFLKRKEWGSLCSNRSDAQVNWDSSPS